MQEQLPRSKAVYAPKGKTHRTPAIMMGFHSVTPTRSFVDSSLQQLLCEQEE
jgi:hypothetical protein